jgi:murein DD-endopeptidase MepM/ murein hydrolase activator NlpD
VKRNSDGKHLCGGHTVVVSQLPKLKARVRFPSPAFLLLILAMTAGCATTEYKPVPEQTTIASPAKAQGIYHKVMRGQTLWRIAKSYGVSVEDIIKSNNIPNIAAIEVNQLLFVPGVMEAKEIPLRTPDENKTEFAWPIRGKILSYFNDRRGEAVNRGVDIEASDGDTVKASREGRVVLADYMSGYGQTLMLDHEDGFITVYAQNQRLLSKLGDRVFKGDPIAEVGRSGKKTFIHFELRKGSTALNPLYYLPS